MSCPLGVSQPREEDTGMWLKMEHGQSIEGHSGTLVSSFGERETLEKLTLKSLDISHWMSSWPLHSAEKSGLGWKLVIIETTVQKKSPREGVERKRTVEGDTWA